MLLLVSGATRYPRDAHVGHFIVPKAQNRSDALDLVPGRWAMDNGAFDGGFTHGAFVWMLEEFSGVPGCLFVAAPDVVGNAAATRKLWPFWSRLIRGLGFPPALVAQDGLAPADVPWSELGALFIGGTTAYKESGAVRSLMAYAKARGLWTHWGRINGRRRYELAVKAGCDSFDGSGFSICPPKIAKVARWARGQQQQPELGL
jgi:hypothetical protein